MAPSAKATSAASILVFYSAGLLPFCPSPNLHFSCWSVVPALSARLGIGTSNLASLDPYTWRSSTPAAVQPFVHALVQPMNSSLHETADWPECGSNVPPGQDIWKVLQVDKSCGLFRWKVPVASITEVRHLSREFPCNGHLWRLVVFKNPAKQNRPPHLAIFIDAADASRMQSSRSKQVLRMAHFQLAICNPKGLDDERKQVLDHTFTTRDNDWGWNEFVTYDKLIDPRAGFVYYDPRKGDFIVLELILKDITLPAPSAMPDAKKTTGFVGLKNQGATCYLNSLLQSLFHLSLFRRRVYEMPTGDEHLELSQSGQGQDVRKSIPLALQRIFCKLQLSSFPVQTHELTKAFGWNTQDAFVQHDIQELNRVLCENLENKMKAHKELKGTMKLFEGKMRWYTKCKRVKHETSREEPFLDMQLRVEGCTNIYDSIRQELEVTLLEGDNQFQTDTKHGLQDAERGFTYTHFPDVLMFHLIRFAYDVESNSQRKVYDRYEFWRDINLGQFLNLTGPQLEERMKAQGGFSPTDGPKVDMEWNYTLHSVLVHTGSINGGHYYAFVRTHTGQWLRFNDDKVEVANLAEVVEENYGGEDDKLREVEKENREAESLYRRKEEEPHTAVIQVVDHAALQKYDEENPLHTDLFDFSSPAYKHIPRNFTFKKSALWSDFIHEVSTKFSIPLDKVRFWKFTGRTNMTSRPDTPTPLFNQWSAERRKTITIREVAHEYLKIKEEKLRDHQLLLDLFLEQPGAENCDSRGQLLPVTHEHALIFFKHFEPDKSLNQSLRYVGHNVFTKFNPVSKVISWVTQNMPALQRQDIWLYEEVRPDMVDEIKLHQESFTNLELGSGDIIVFQTPATGACKNPYVPNMFKHIENRISVRFANIDKPSQILFTLPLVKTMSLQRTQEKVAAELSKNQHTTCPENIQFTPPDYSLKGAAEFPLREGGFLDQPENTLAHMLAIPVSKPDPRKPPLFGNLLFVEVLELPLAQLDTKRPYHVSIFTSPGHMECTFRIYVDKKVCVEHLLAEAESKAKKNGKKVQPASKLTLYEVQAHKITRVLQASDPVSGI
eukprot:gene7203-1287_t